MSRILSILLVASLATGLHAGPKGGSSFSGGSKPSFSGGSSFKPSSSSPKPSTPAPSTPKPASTWSGGSKPSATAPAPAKSSFSGGSTATKPASGGATTNPPPKSVSLKPAAPSFDTLAIGESKKVESRANYEKATAPKPSYKSTTTGKEIKIDSSAKETATLRREMDQEKWVKRPERTTVIYNTYTSRPNYTPIVLGPTYHPDFGVWLLAQSLDTMALTIYHHNAMMDAARLRSLYDTNAGLEARVKALEAQKLVRDTSYVPPGMERDLMYDDDYVDAVYNPTPRLIEKPYDGPTWYGFWHGVWVLMKWCFYLVVGGALIYGVAYVLFIHRWGE